MKVQIPLNLGSTTYSSMNVKMINGYRYILNSLDYSKVNSQIGSVYAYEEPTIKRSLLIKSLSKIQHRKEAYANVREMQSSFKPLRPRTVGGLGHPKQERHVGAGVSLRDHTSLTENSIEEISKKHLDKLIFVQLVLHNKMEPEEKLHISWMM